MPTSGDVMLLICCLLLGFADQLRRSLFLEFSSAFSNESGKKTIANGRAAENPGTIEMAAAIGAP